MFKKDNDLFVIAEIGGNHEGNFDYAKHLLAEAIESGAHAVKFQIYRADKIVSPVEGSDRNAHFKKFELKDEQFFELANIAKSAEVQFLASLWDSDSLATYDPILPMHKVGSGDLTNYPLLISLVRTGKPIIISTAMATLEEVNDTVAFVESVDPAIVSDGRLCIMHCVAMYGEPKDEFAELGAITALRDAFPGVPIGYSDHTIGTYACELAVALGVRTFEIHFTDDKTREFRDHQLSVTKDEMQEFIANARRAITLMGRGVKAPVESIETPERIQQFRRAVYFKRDLPAGHQVCEEDIVTLRPNVGIDARKFSSLLGRKLRVDKRAYEALAEEEFETT